MTNMKYLLALLAALFISIPATAQNECPTGTYPTTWGRITDINGNQHQTACFDQNGSLTINAGNINSKLIVDGIKYKTIDAALSDCPQSGCFIAVKSGSVPCPTSTITVPIILEGNGAGGFSNPGTDTLYNSATILTNSSQTANCINIGLPAGNSLSGVTIKNLAIQGNNAVVGSTSGDGIKITGGGSATQIIHTLIDNVISHDNKGSGLTISDNVFLVNITNSQFTRNNSNGISITNTGLNGSPSQIRMLNSTLWLNTGDGLNINSTKAIDFSVALSTFANNANGVNIVAGSVNARFSSFSSSYESNTTAGILIKDGFGHSIIGNQFPGDSVQLFGIELDPPSGANFVQNQMVAIGNNFQSNVTNDIKLTANTHLAFIGPQAQNNYSYSDASAVGIRLDNDSLGALNFVAFGGMTLAKGFGNPKITLTPQIANIGSLTSCSSSLEGVNSVANNCNAACSVGGTCTAGGSTHCQVYCNGTTYIETGR